MNDNNNTYHTQQVVSHDNNNIADVDDENDYNNLDEQIANARCELQKLRQKRERETHEWTKDLRAQKQALEQSRNTLHAKLNNPRALHGKAMECLKRRYIENMGQNESLPPVYVLHKEATLIATTSFSFTVLQNQIRVTKSHHNKLVKFLKQERLRVLTELDAANRQSVEDVSLVAERNHACYDDYQHQIDELNTQMKRLLTLLQEKSDDGSTLQSDTEHSLSEHSYTDEDATKEESSEDAPSFNHEDSSSPLQLTHMVTDFFHSSLDNLLKLPVVGV